MFERFAVDARQAVVDAQEIARDRGAATIEAVHVLLGVARQDGPAARALASVGVGADDLDRHAAAVRSADLLDGEALASLGIDLDAVRARTDAAFGAGALERAGRRRRRGHVAFTKEAAKALERSLREAVALHATTIDSGHVLLALLQDEGTTAHRTLAAALAAAGSTPDALRSVLLDPGSAGAAGRRAAS
ncbi:Clp protease N-terminal domain-containing protein [Cellulosimicrobium marinum]|uniref:Clp protease N-terminal domain-containing protein n=1 Tax=Cellulosimicrobium marinum TaxID=1638992 RepID=UPI001E4E1BF9|nr:Clp protease N-terminal domain-containing protein [Cellulosimicrobium marinum]MCB7136673.1 hypothetical protein [Cellulosimicrobium marinum]